MIKLESELVESCDFAGFYHHPEIESIVVSRNGYVIDIRGNYCPIPTMSNGYWTVTIRGRGAFKVHRLLAETFLREPAGIERPIVNHLDGIKTNNDLTNLEWTDYSGNIIHAYATGLRSDSRPILLKDIITGELTEFNSLQEAARHFNVNGSEMYRYLSNGALVPWKKRYELIYVGDNWRGLTGDDVGKVNNGQSKEIVAVRDGVTYIFASIADTSRALGISLYKLYSGLANNKLVDNTVVKYLEEYDGDTDDAIRHVAHKSTIVRPNFKRSPVPISVTDISTGETVQWESCEEFARVYGVTKSAIQRSMLYKEGRWRHFLIKYIK